MNCGSGREEMGRGGQIEAAYAGLHFVRACVVIAEGESEHDRQPEDGADDDKLGALGTIACMHEVEQREQKDPHDIDEVPVQTYDFDGGVVLRREAAAE